MAGINGVRRRPEEEERRRGARCRAPQLGLMVEDDVAEAGEARGLDGEARGGRRLRK